MTNLDSTTKWYRSTRCDSGTCVEVAHQDDFVAVRDSKNPDAAVLHFSPPAWRAFVNGIRVGEFEHLVK